MGRAKSGRLVDVSEKAIKGAIAKAGVKGTEIDAIGISYQMHGLVLVDKRMQVLRPSIIGVTAVLFRMETVLSSRLAKSNA